MTKRRLFVWTALFALLGAGWFAVEGFLRMQARARERDEVVRKLVEARSLIARHPAIFERDAKPAADIALKSLVQEAATKHGLTVGFLAESEKEAGKGKRERQVSARLVRAPHSRIVPFLAELEGRGEGAIVKELHLRPSKDLSDTYEDAEIILARLRTIEEAKP